MKNVTYEDRVAKMHDVSDIDRQIRRADRYVKKLRREMKKAPTLSDKIEIYKAVKESELVFCKLRLNFFELEDKLAKNLTPLGCAPMSG